MKGGKTFVGHTVSVVCFKVHVDFVFENMEIADLNHLQRHDNSFKSKNHITLFTKPLVDKIMSINTNTKSLTE